MSANRDAGRPAAGRGRAGGERRTGPRTAGVGEGLAAAVRRRQRERGPRVLLYDRAGHAQAIAPSAPGYDELLAIAQEMLAVAETAQRGRRPRTGRGR